MTPKDTLSLPATPLLDAMDALDSAIDDTHPEGDGCDICRAADKLRSLVEDDAERIAATARVEGLREALAACIQPCHECDAADIARAALAEAPARPPDTIEDHGIVFGDPDA